MILFIVWTRKEVLTMFGGHVEFDGCKESRLFRFRKHFRPINIYNFRHNNIEVFAKTK